jgi:hypothetical protein
MRLDYEMGVELGRAIEQIKLHRDQIEALDTRVERVEIKVAMAESWIGRGIAAGSLWVAGAGLNLSAENVGQMLAKLLR